MITISGYDIERQLHEGKRSLIYAATRGLDHLPVVVKVVKSLYPALSETLRFQQEYIMLRKLGAYGVVRAYTLDTVNNRPYIAMEDFGGTSLDRCYRFDESDICETLTLFMRVAEILDDIHRQRVIHKDINPSNIVWNRQTGQVKLIDFGISSSAIREINEARRPDVLEGTLAYISPEQTGRMSRSVDYRSDLYSLGITFYELLTGKTPFDFRDPMELVYAHLAKTAPAPSAVNAGIPSMVSDIVVRLMEKEPDDRYQSAFGLKADLAACLQYCKQSQTIPVFALGESDTPEYFQVPQKLFGRTSEQKALLAAFDRISRTGREMYVVAGPAGIGKSALVHEIAGPVTDRGGFFISGKFDQFKRDIPYASIIAAFQKLILKLLSESPETVAYWRDRLNHALKPNAGVMVNVIPELAMIIGEPPPVPELSPIEAKNRFNLVFQNFVDVFADAGHPLVVFWDDLQWADLSSLKLLELLMGGAVDNQLLIIGAYRQSEVSAADSLMLTLDNIASQGTAVNRMTLNALGKENVAALVAETLQTDESKTAEIAELCFSRTGGNPFFLNQLLYLLYEEGAFAFDRQNRCWQWNIEAIERIQVTDNVVDFMIAKIERLSEQTREMLKTAACIGNRFELSLLAAMHGVSPAEADRRLWPALHEGLIFAQAAENVADDRGGQKRRITYMFAHDRIQQAVYTVIDMADRKHRHWRLGRYIREESVHEGHENHLFEIVNHFNAGADLVSFVEDRLEIAKYNYKAGMKSKDSAAYEAAFNYFKAGIELLPDDCWQTHYDLTVALYIHGAETAYLNSESSRMALYAEVVLKNAANRLDRIRIQRVKIQSLIAENRLVDAIRMALDALRHLGVRLPVKPGPLEVIAGMLVTRVRLYAHRKTDPVLREPMEDPLRIAAMQLLMATASPAFFAAPKLLPLLAFQQIRLSLKYGNAAETPVAFCVYGLVECGVTGHIDSGFHHGKKAIELSRQLGTREYECRVLVIFNSQIRHWQRHARQTLGALLEAYQVGLETGDLEYAAYAVHIHCCNCFCVGKNLAALQRSMVTYSSAIRRLNQKTAYNFQQIWHQALLNLRTGAEQPARLVGEIYDEDTMLPRHRAANDRTAIFDVYFHKLMLSYLFGDYAGAVAHAKAAETYADGVTGMLYVPVMVFYSALACLALCREMPDDLRRQRMVNRVGRMQKKMKKWAAHCPENFEHKYWLIKAEYADISTDEAAARQYFKKAIEAAARNEYHNERAIANECYARYWMDKNEPVMARHYIHRAREQYRIWGASGKVRDIENRYADLLQVVDADIGGDTTAEHTSEMPVAAGGLDSVSVLKASQAIAGEIQLPSLLKKMMALVVENAGAQTGLLLLKRDAGFTVEAEIRADRDEATVLNAMAFEDAELPRSIIRFVETTREAMVLDDAANEQRFAEDDYLRHRQPKSVLCMPIMHQNTLVGILYAENNLVYGSFTRHRLEALTVISSQAAIALENAMLYEDLEVRVQQRTAELENSLNDLRAAQKKLVESEKMASLGGLVAGVAHEVNTPIGVSVTAASFLQEKTEAISNQSAPTEADWAKYLQTAKDSTRLIVTNLQRAADLVKSFKQVAVDQSAEKRRTFNVGQYIDEILVSMGPRLKRTRHEVSVNCPENQEIDSFPGAFAQVVTNLVMNSLVHGFEDIEQGRITLDVYPEKEGIRLQYRDNGRGMDQDSAARVFEPFFTTRRAHGGAGLGMHVVYNIVTQTLGGTVECQSAPGEGVAFDFYLPGNGGGSAKDAENRDHP
ncbi:MAG: trifunctional serine/threonine-protein kinase/ATP-binding protein/sensor histidine kinase [Thermodesulfobacteriota bacterium]